MKTRSELKSESKELLKGHWGKAILLNIIPVAGSIISMSLIGLCVFLISSFVDSDSARHVAEAIGSTNSDVSARSSGANVGSSVTSIIGTLLTVGVMFTTIDWLRTKKADFNTASGIFAVFAKVFCRYDYFGHFDDDFQSSVDLVLCHSGNRQILFIFADLLHL